MLARNFKTAEELGLSDAEYRGLKATLRALETGELNKETGFDMRIYWEENEGCGTVGCIAGWARYFSGDPNVFGWHGKLPRYTNGREPLWNLFHTFYSPITTPLMAAHALANYLTTGNANWPEVYDVHCGQRPDKLPWPRVKPT